MSRLRQSHPMSRCKPGKIAGAVVDWHAVWDEYVCFTLRFELEDPLTSLVVALPTREQCIGQCRILSEDTAIDGRELLRFFLVVAFLGQDYDELLESLSLGLTQRDSAVLPHHTVDIHVPIKEHRRHDNRHRR